MLTNRIKRLIFTVLFIFFLYQLSYAETIKIATANLYAGNLNKKKITKQLLDLKADIIIILEWTGGNIEREKFEDYTFIVNEPRFGTHGIAILSKKTLDSYGELLKNPVNSPCAMPFASISFKLDNKNITVLAIHPPPPIKVCEKATGKTIKAVQNWVEDGKLNTNVGSGKTNDYLIIAGDLNSFSFEKEIKNFEKIGMIDSIKKAKGLYIGTWSPSKYIPKLIRIDYIFVSKHLNLLKSNTFKISGSDHRGVWAEIKTE